MISLKHMSASMLFLLTVVGTSGASAATKTMSVPALHALVDGLGLEDTGDKGSYVEIDNQGARNLSIVLRPVESDTYVQFYTRLGIIPKGKVEFMPSNKMLEYNDNHSFYFTLGGPDGDLLFLQARLNAAAMTPQLVRQQIDALTSAADESAELWDVDKWQVTPNSGCQAAGANLSFAATATLVTDKDSTATDVHKRHDQNFKIDEPFIFYIQPSNFSCTKDGGSYKANFSVDAQLFYNGQVAVDQKNVLKQEFTAGEPIKSVGLNLTDKITGLIPGEFLFKLKVHDLVGDKSAEQTIAVTLVK